MKGEAGGAEDVQVDVAVELELAGKNGTWCGARKESRVRSRRKAILDPGLHPQTNGKPPKRRLSTKE